MSVHRMGLTQIVQRISMTGILFGMLIPSCWGQQTIFNVPSADVTPEGKVFLQHEAQFKPYGNQANVVFTEYTAVGIGHGIELDSTLFNVGAPATHNISLGLGFKKRVNLWPESLPKTELAITAGSMMPISFYGQGVGNWSYAHVSGRLPGLKTRLTAGVSAGTKEIFTRDTVSAIAGIEQPVTKRVSLIADWYSGTHGLGFLITGASVVLTPSMTLYLGYQIPNNARCGTTGLVFELAKFF